MAVKTVMPVTGMPAASTVPREGDPAAQVALAYMPFAALGFPALGISLLKAALAQQGIA
jgi:hypothetical protein